MRQMDPRLAERVDLVALNDLAGRTENDDDGYAEGK